jgi:hypothetical protein
MLFSILIYGFMIKQLPIQRAKPSSIIYLAIALLSVSIIRSLFFFRKKLIKPSEDVLAVNAVDAVAVRRWQTGQLITYAFAEAIAVYGLLLHFLGLTHVQVVPFLVVSFLLILFFPPRLPVPTR